MHLSIRRLAVLAGFGALATLLTIGSAAAQAPATGQSAPSATPKGAPTPFGKPAPAAPPKSLGAAPAVVEATPPGTKVVIASIQEAIFGTQEGKKELEALQKKFDPEQTALKNMNDEVEKMKAELALMAKGLSNDDRAKRQKAIDDKNAALKTRYEADQKEFQKAQQDAINRVGQKMVKVLESYATAKGYDLVEDVSSPQAPVLWARPRINITAALIEAYDKQYPVK